jgi:hypothetical protein
LQIVYSARFLSSYVEAPLEIRKRCDKQIQFLSDDTRHPSLRAKKFDEQRSIWQGRVNRSWRFYFTIDGDTYTTIDVIPHPK